MKVIKRFSDLCWQGKEELCNSQLGKVGCAVESLVELDRRCQDTSREIPMLSKKQ